MQLLCYILIFFLIFEPVVGYANQTSPFSEKESLKRVYSVSSSSAISTALSKAEIALCKSIILPAHLKGEYGEAVVGKFYLEKFLQKTSNWQSIYSKLGRQGIDCIFIKFDSWENPIDIMVGEVKYGSSQLQRTKDGIQMSRRWVSKRLLGLGKRYIGIADANDILIQQRPSFLYKPRHMIEINVNGKKVIFWRKSAKEPWKVEIEGNLEDIHLFIEKAKKKAKKIGLFLIKAAEGKIKIRRRIFQVKVKDDYLYINIKDAKYIDKGLKLNQIKGRKIKIPLAGESGQLSRKVLINEIAKQLKQKMPYLGNKECEQIAEEILSRNNLKSINFSKFDLYKTFIKSSLTSGTIGTVIGMVIELIDNEKIKFESLLKTGGLGFVSGTISTLGGNLIKTSIYKYKGLYNPISKVATSIIKIPPGLYINLLSESFTFGLASILMSYGGYLLDYYDINTANKLAISGVGGSIGGFLAAQGTLYLVATYATASTGTAISTLSGAAATNASLAWLGGGSIATGGCGIYGGYIVLGGIFTLGAFITNYAIFYAYHLLEEKRDRRLTCMLLTEFKKGEVFRKEAERLF